MTRFARVWQVSDLKWNNMTKIQNYKETPWGKTPHHWRLSTIKEETEVVTDYVANGSFASLAENVKYKSEEDYAVLIRLVDYNNQYKGDFVFIDKDAYEFLGKSKLFGDEIIISNVGANVGTVFRCPKLKYKMSLAPNSIMVKFKGDNDFYYYWLKSKYGQFMIQSIVTGSAQPKFNKTNFRDMLIPVPPISEQIRIAETIKSIDDKIECNRRINDNLEQQAQALFKSWFVDFEPFRDQPFVESELGMIPEGWKVGKLSDIADIYMGASPAGSSYNVLGIGDVFYQGRAEFGVRFPQRNMYTTEAKRFAEVNSVLLSVRAPVGDINVAEERCCIGRGLASIKSKTNHNSFNLYLMKQLKPIFDTYNGEGTVFGCINKKALESLKIIIPDGNVIDKFDSIVSYIDEKIRVLEKQSRTLSSLRDTLLPRLMSGELEVKDIEQSL